VHLEPRPPDAPDLALLLDLALKELIDRYPDSPSTHYLDPATEFLVAVDTADAASDLIGCIGLMPVVEGVGEIKRMFVRADHRGRGVARLLVPALESLAGGRGATSLRLATGRRQPEAVALYESLGYRRTAPYGKYVHDPLALCYAKLLP
jgi:GNAT superfamily N-acetyltransferase